MTHRLPDILGDLRAIGLRAGHCVEVHSSLRAIGCVEGGPETVVSALMGVVGTTGAVVMSAYPLSPPLPVNAQERRRGIAWKVRRYPEDSRPRTGMGAVADAFRDHPDTALGTGIHRVCAWGKDADLHAQGYRHLVDAGGCALLIGVGIDRCSSLHLADDVPIPEAALSRMDQLWGRAGSVAISEDVRARYPSDVILGGPDGWVHGDPWRDARDEADRRGLVTRGKVGDADALFFGVSEVLCLLEEVRRRGPFRRESDGVIDGPCRDRFPAAAPQ